MDLSDASLRPESWIDGSIEGAPLDGAREVGSKRDAFPRHVPDRAIGQIAAIARVNGLVLVTRNVSDFSSFVDLEVEKWDR